MVFQCMGRAGYKLFAGGDPTVLLQAIVPFEPCSYLLAGGSPRFIQANAMRGAMPQLESASAKTGASISSAGRFGQKKPL
jgi:hypothetical protein